MHSVHKILHVLLSGCLLLGSASCKKYLDINTDPTTATTVEPKLLFGYAITAWNTNRNSGDTYVPVAFMAQTIASGGNYGWGAGNVYEIPSFSLGNTWKVYYSTAGNNLKLAIDIALNSTPANKNTALQCQIMLAELMYECTMLYGDVPFSEAWRADIPYPKYDPQKDVLEGILKMLDDAVAQFDEASPLKISDYDIYYQGSIPKWKKLATSLKLKVLMAMVDKDPSKAAAIGQLVASPASMIASAAENWLHPYKTATNNENPKYRLLQAYTNGQNQWFFANSNVYNYMQPKNDPRIPRYFDKGPASATYKAVETEEEANNTTALISAYLYRKDAPDVLLSYQEVLLLQAEAYARGLGVTQDLAKANTLYRQGLAAAMSFYQADATQVSTYMSTQLSDLTKEADPVREIHIQQWIDLMDRPLDAFVLWRRSGPEGSEVPTLTLPRGAPAGPLIRRFILSPDEILANPKIPAAQPFYYTKMWFDL